jgi:hypothetical protein
MKFIFSFSAFLALALLANAQPGKPGLYMPLEFQKAYDKGTRKPDGRVSSSYWQNSSDYKLKARIDPAMKILHGEGLITYHNNSPDSIARIVFHTYADYYRRESRHDGPFSGTKVSETDGMVITKLSLDGEICAITNKDRVTHNGTNYSIKLTKKLPPRSSLTIEASWHYEIAGKDFERSGAIDSTSMFIGYWYPEVSVRDDIDGWDEAIKDFRNDVLTIENRGGRPIALDLIIHYADGSSEKERVNPSVWKDSAMYTRKMDRMKEIDSIRLEPELGPDALSSNNSWPAE